MIRYFGYHQIHHHILRLHGKTRLFLRQILKAYYYRNDCDLLIPKDDLTVHFKMQKIIKLLIFIIFLETKNHHFQISICF